MFYVYLLKSKQDGYYYIGQTDNASERLKEHNLGRVKLTYKRIPFEILGYETYNSRNEARYREYCLKKHTTLKVKFIKKIMGR